MDLFSPVRACITPWREMACFSVPLAVLNSKHQFPRHGLVLQGIWAALLVLARTRLVDPNTGAITYGNLYSDLLDYVVFAVLIFYVLTIYGLFVLRRKRPDAERPYRAFGYPVIPALISSAAIAIMVVLILYKTQTTWPGLVIVLLGVPVYMFWSGDPRQQNIARDVPVNVAAAVRFGDKVDMESKSQLFATKPHSLSCSRNYGARSACTRVPGTQSTLKPWSRRNHRNGHFRPDRNCRTRPHRARP